MAKRRKINFARKKKLCPLFLLLLLPPPPISRVVHLSTPPEKGKKGGRGGGCAKKKNEYCVPILCPNLDLLSPINLCHLGTDRFFLHCRVLCLHISSRID